VGSSNRRELRLTIPGLTTQEAASEGMGPRRLILFRFDRNPFVGRSRVMLFRRLNPGGATPDGRRAFHLVREVFGG